MKVIYPGSFDPLTYGHIDIIERCLERFDEVVVAVLNNQLKKGLFSVSERIELIKNHYKNNSKLKIVSFEGLLVDFCRREQIQIVVRGIRNIQDFEFESQLARLNKALYRGMETFFLFSESEFSYVSSSFIKDIASFGGDVSKFVPRNVEKALENKYRGGK